MLLPFITNTFLKQIAGRFYKYLAIVEKYVQFLTTAGTTVSGSFDADRVPAPVVIGVLGTYVHDQHAVDAAKAAGVVLLAPSGKVLQAAAVATGVTLKAGSGNGDKDEDTDDEV